VAALPGEVAGLRLEAVDPAPVQVGVGGGVQPVDAGRRRPAQRPADGAQAGLEGAFEQFAAAAAQGQEAVADAVGELDELPGVGLEDVAEGGLLLFEQFVAAHQGGFELGDAAQGPVEIEQFRHDGPPPRRRRPAAAGRL
jgi:hypothetical protein